MMSAQLGVILIILVAIVINSANSYDKMEQLNRSAEEVFFAIENQEADDDVSDRYEPGAEIVVERNREPEEDSEDEKGTTVSAGESEGLKEDAAEGVSAENTEVEKTDQGDIDTAERKDTDVRGENTDDGKEKSGNVEKETETQREEPAVEEGSLKPAADTTEQSDSEGTEALSRNVTRYYEVERGDTLYTICEKIYGDTLQVEKICELNDISDPDRIRSGQKIILP